MTTNARDELNGVDALNLVALFLLAVVVAFFRRELGGEAVRLLGVYASLAVLVVGAPLLSRRRPAWRYVHDFSPVLLVLVVFNTLGPIIDCASPGRWDAVFMRIDAQLFGELAAGWRGLLGRPTWLVDAASVAYVGYYLLPLLLAVKSYRRHPLGEFRAFVFTVLLTFYISYVGYFMCPTIGPRIPADADAMLTGGAVSHAIRAFIDLGERTRTDAFPSGHTAVALVCLYSAWYMSRKLFALCVPVVCGIVFSTIYLHYHYVIDVVAGAGLACACVWLSPRLQPLLEPRELRKRMAFRLGTW